jgi:hypothetical protein
MRNASASPSATGFYVLETSNGGRSYVARPFKSFDMIGGENPAMFTRAQVEQMVVSGASVTFQLVPPAVKIGGLPPWLAIALGVVGAGVGGALLSRGRGR